MLSAEYRRVEGTRGMIQMKFESLFGKKVVRYVSFFTWRVRRKALGLNQAQCLLRFVWKNSFPEVHIRK